MADMTPSPTYIRDIVSPVLVYKDLQEGLLREQSHPDNPDLRVIGYTEVVQYGGQWDDATLEMRGLVYNSRTDEILARPFSKFFTQGQAEAVEPSLDSEIVAYDKADGSLISFGVYGVSTRGSFVSDQAIAAGKWLDDRPAVVDWASAWVAQGVTPLFEWVGPDNRIVLQYDENELILLGGRRIDSGTYVYPERMFAPSGLRVVERVFSGTYGEFLAAGSELLDRGLEGVVIWSGPGGPCLKIKEERYVELHKLVTGLNEKAVWAVGPAGLAELLERLPDEFHEWTKEVFLDLQKKSTDIVLTANYLHGKLTSGSIERRDWMNWLRESGFAQYSRYVFALADGRDILPIAWEAVKPVGDTNN